MKNEQVILTPDYETVRPSHEEVTTIMGYPPGSEPAYIPEMLEVLLDEATSHASAGGCYSIFDIIEINVAKGLILNNSGTIKCGSKIAKQLMGSDSFALFLVTAGESFDDWIKSKASGGDVLAEYMCSSIGSSIADKVADVVQEEVKRIAVNTGKGITNRYSPGYCSWNIREQRSIFDLLPAERIGVRLTPSFLMNPIKSVSGIIGIGVDKVPGPYMCDLCNMANCLVKKARGL